MKGWGKVAGQTDHYGLTTLGSGDTFAHDGHKYTGADRRLIDSLLHLGAEGHRHSGQAAVDIVPTIPPGLTLNSTGGTIPAATRVHYKYTWVSTRGEETAAGPESYVDTPEPITAPGGATLGISTSGGALAPGNYYYVLTAYTSVSTAETRAVNPTYVPVPATTTTNAITLTMPSLPGGATGFNIYRRAPGQTKYFFLASTTASSYEDDGSVAEDCDRSVPSANSTNGTNSIDVELPVAVPAGYTWRLYRTYTAGDWRRSFLMNVLQWIDDETPTVITEVTDVGNGTAPGSPPVTSQLVGSPSKIDLADGAEVEGMIPMGLVSYPTQVVFNYEGPLEEVQGSTVWVSDFPSAEIISCRAVLGRGYSPDEDPVIVDVNMAAEDPNPEFATIFTTQANRPTVPVGAQCGDRVTPDVTLLSRGDMLTMDIDQTGGGDTPTDRDLTVTIYLIAHGYPTDESYVPEQTGGSEGDF